MRMGIREIDWPMVGAMFANESDSNQAAFFKALVKEFRTWDTNHQAEMQLAFVNGRLTADERELLSMLGLPDEKE